MQPPPAPEKTPRWTFKKSLNRKVYISEFGNRMDFRIDGVHRCNNSSYAIGYEVLSLDP